MLCIYHGRKFSTAELLKTAIITEWQKLSRFIDNSINEWCRGLESVVKNDCGHVEHCKCVFYWIVRLQNKGEVKA